MYVLVFTICSQTNLGRMESEEEVDVVWKNVIVNLGLVEPQVRSKKKGKKKKKKKSKDTEKREDAGSKKKKKQMNNNSNPL